MLLLKHSQYLLSNVVIIIIIIIIIIIVVVVVVVVAAAAAAAAAAAVAVAVVVVVIKVYFTFKQSSKDLHRQSVLGPSSVSEDLFRICSELQEVPWHPQQCCLWVSKVAEIDPWLWGCNNSSNNNNNNKLFSCN